MYETEAMKKLSVQVGLDQSIIINTCAVTAEAVRKAKQDIRKLHHQNPGKKVIVTGCAAQIAPKIFAEMDEVDTVVGNTEKMQLETWINLSGNFNTEPIQVDDIMSVTETANHLIDGFGTRSRAYVQVQNGCDHRCTFCIIPYGRGNSRSVPAGVIVDQIKRLVNSGYAEVVLTGVDMTSWGGDLPNTPRLGDLIMRILKLVPDLQRLRISSIDSIEVDPALMEALATETRLMPHLHLSLQHGDDLILKRMKRRHLRDDAIKFTQDALRLRPDITFGADIIVGFPTETEAQFENSIALVTECNLTWLHVFPYSVREGTPAARMPQINGNLIKSRAAQLRTVGTHHTKLYLKSQVGKMHQVLMEKAHMGRTEQFAKVLFDRPQRKGKIVSTLIKSTTEIQLQGQAV